MRNPPLSLAVAALALGIGALVPEPGHAARAGGGAGPALATGPHAPRDAAMLRPGRLGAARAALADRDRDGLVTADEAEAYFKLRFSFMDGDGDGALDGAEFVRGGAGLRRTARETPLRRGRAPGFAAADVDGDGRLSREEFLLARLDANARASGPKARREAGRRRVALFKALDADGDGVVGRDEFMAAGAAHFAERDGDADGAVTVWEFRAGPRF